MLITRKYYQVKAEIMSLFAVKKTEIFRSNQGYFWEYV